MAHVEAQGGLGRKYGKLTVGIWLGLSTGWATVAIDWPPAALGAPHAPYTCYQVQEKGKGLTPRPRLIIPHFRGSFLRWLPPPRKASTAKSQVPARRPWAPSRSPQAREPGGSGPRLSGEPAGEPLRRHRPTSQVIVSNGDPCCCSPPFVRRATLVTWVPRLLHESAFWGV